MERLGAGDPRWIGDYRLLGRLGEGGMGRVYLARSQRGRTVAVKAVKNELARQPDFRRRFSQEITAARRVGGTWTAPVLDADTEAETPWVATGYIAGPSLAEVVDDQYGPLPADSVGALASGLTRALRDIHGAGLVHRDLKPSNVLITIDGPRVIDFGIARALDSAVQSAGGLTRTGALVGSPGFMSPEQVRGQHVTPASDIFCLGAVLAYAATGRMPFGTSDSGVHALLFRIAEEEPDLSGLSGQLHDLVSGCLTKDPEKRPGLETLISRTEGELSGTWLPGEVLAQLGRHAVQLLDSEDPDGETQAGGFASAGVTAGPGPSTPPPAAPGPSTPPPSTPQP
ncbi:serine/threonine-protein kinase, partial [Streptomyces albidus (ex Kaewkla and Franco 2022)]|uniref:serine/threonine-protein kinase n=1 Tax=Streptomyces albidus (ex Kaewkla and Franco 2022) TaxID=722709 RepID=UPI0015EF926E